LKPWFTCLLGCLPAILPSCQVVFDSVSKSYAQGPTSSSHTPALSQLSQHIYPGECFALLGANGAGKTTAIRVLTGEAEPDSGDAFIAGYSVTHQLAAAQRCIGYSPQFEALTPGLTGRELLLLYAALRGVKSKQQAAEIAEQLLQGLQLVELADVACGAYSGGNKARLSVAVALVAHPQLVLLDEPSTGMDAAARHALWKVLQVRQQASSGTELTDSNHSRRGAGKLSFIMKLLLDRMTRLFALCKPGPLIAQACDLGALYEACTTGVAVCSSTKKSPMHAHSFFLSACL
jgi:ABC-type Na+ transport system ATPase subunit NatA